MTSQIKTLAIIFIAAFCLLNTSCRKNVRGDVRMYGNALDAYDNAPIKDMQFELVRKERRSGETLLAPEISYDSISGNYEVKYISSSNAKRGYNFRWWAGNTDYEYYYDNFEYEQELIDGNDCPIDIRLKRFGHMTVRLIDVAPFDYLPYPEFLCDGNEQAVNLFNFNGDTTFTVKLQPDHDNFYELISTANNFTDTIIVGSINMNASGDTLFNTLQF
jgi:hypothetical protein